MREGDRVRVIVDFDRPGGGTIPAGTFGLLGVCEGNLGHVLLDIGGAAIVPVDMLRTALPRQLHRAEPSDPPDDTEESKP